MAEKEIPQKETTLKEEIQKINEHFEVMVAKKEHKRFNIPFASRVGKKKVKDGYVTICYISENRGVKFMKAPIKEGVIMVDGAPHLATTDYLLNYKNRPFIIVPSWNTEPFSPEANLEKARAAQTTSFGYRLLLNTLKSEQLKQKGKMGTGIILIVLAVLAGGYYLLSGGGGI